MRRLRKSLLLLFGAYLGVIALLTLLETKLIYPAPDVMAGDWKPAWLEYEDVWIETRLGNKVHGWYCAHDDPQNFILIFHGNGEHVAFMAEELDFLRTRYNASVLAIDYRGYGKSVGSPFQIGVLADAEAAHEWLVNRASVPPENIVLWGRSLGGAIAVHVAAHSGARAIVLDRTFNSMVDVASTHFPWLPVKLLLKNRYPTEQWARAYEGPVLQVHGKPDSVVPFSAGQTLFAAFPSDSKQFIDSEHLHHNSPWPQDYYLEVESFLMQISRD